MSRPFLGQKLRFWPKKLKKVEVPDFAKNYYFENQEKTLLVILSTIYRKSDNSKDFMNCHKSQLNVNYKYWLIKWLFFMWAYG